METHRIKGHQILLVGIGMLPIIARDLPWVKVPSTWLSYIPWFLLHPFSVRLVARRPALLEALFLYRVVQ